MTNADRLTQWNQWYDNTPEHWRTHIVLWPLVFAGFLNMQLTIAGGFPFGLLVLLAMLVMAAIRVPYLAGWIKPGPSGAHFELGRIDWLHDVNTRYDALPERTRFWLPPAILIVAGTLNIWLLAARGWAFGSLLLIALLAMIAIRAPFSWHWITPPTTDERRPVTVSGWLADTNAWYDGLEPDRKMWTSLLALAVLLVIDIWLLGAGVPLLLVLLLDVLAVAALRGPYIAGMLNLPERGVAPLALSAAPRQIEHHDAATMVDPAVPIVQPIAAPVHEPASHSALPPAAHEPHPPLSE